MPVNAGDIHRAIAGANLPIVSVQFRSNNDYSLIWEQTATQEQKNQGDALAQAAIAEDGPLTPRWKVFRNQFRKNAAVRRCRRRSTNNLSANDLAAAITAIEPDFDIIKEIWNEVIVDVPPADAPTASEILTWNNIAVSTRVPLTFKTDGTL